eukprot:4002424-Amphidinium_carterae.1
MARGRFRVCFHASIFPKASPQKDGNHQTQTLYLANPPRLNRVFKPWVVQGQLRLAVLLQQHLPPACQQR